LLDGFHKLVTVLRLLGDHGERQQAKLAIVECPAAAPALGAFAPLGALAAIAVMVVVMMPPMTAIRHVIGLGELTV
jgi:hypothetical protein